MGITFKAALAIGPVHHLTCTCYQSLFSTCTILAIRLSSTWYRISQFSICYQPILLSVYSVLDISRYISCYRYQPVQYLLSAGAQRLLVSASTVLAIRRKSTVLVISQSSTCYQPVQLLAASTYKTYYQPVLYLLSGGSVLAVSRNVTCFWPFQYFLQYLLSDSTVR
jgi:hypothetical protein